MAESQIVFRTKDLAVGVFRCAPDDPAWDRDNCIGPQAHLVFPSTAVGITQEGRTGVVASSARVILYDPERRYRRHLLSERGDRCTFIALSGALRERAVGGRAFPTTHLPLGDRAFLSQWLLVRAARAGYDDLDLHERALQLVDAVCGPIERSVATTRGSVAAEAVEEAQALVTGRFREQLSLEELSAAVHLSPFHLSRVFRARTGRSLRGFRDRIRLRHSLDELADTDASVAEIAVGLGYSSHSHFTGRFRAAFGVPPSAVRHAPGTRKLLEA